MQTPNIQTPCGLRPVTCLPDEVLVEAYLSAAGGSVGADVVQLLRYAVSPDNDGAKKAGALLRCCLEGVGVLVAVYPGLGQMVPAGSVRVGDIIDGVLYFVPSAKYCNIRNKTAFDFCNDAGLLLVVTECTSKEEFTKDLPIIERARAFMDLAERTNDRALMAAVSLFFADEIAAYLASFNE